MVKIAAKTPPEEDPQVPEVPESVAATLAHVNAAFRATSTRNPWFAKPRQVAIFTTGHLFEFLLHCPLEMADEGAVILPSRRLTGE